MPKAMKLVDSHNGKMQCKHCCSEHDVSIKSGGGYVRGSWQCSNQNCPSKAK